MAYSQAHIDALKDAIASGAKRVTDPEGITVEYRDLAHMRQILGMMEAEVFGASAISRRRRGVRVRTVSGY